MILIIPLLLDKLPLRLLFILSRSGQSLRAAPLVTFGQ